MAALPLSTRRKDSPNQQSPLLKLPGELRNRIYRLVLLSDDSVAINVSGASEPDLLLACREVRNEAITIYYSENNFEIHTPAYDATLGFRWNTLCRIRMAQHDIKTMSGRLSFGRETEPSWPNLLKWLRRYHAQSMDITSCPPSLAPKGMAADRLVVGGMFRIIAGMSDKPWDVVYGVLEEQHHILVSLDGRWEEATDSQENCEIRNGVWAKHAGAPDLDDSTEWKEMKQLT